MRFLPDSRGQSVQIGAVLLFGVLIILLSTWQAFVIPDQNEGIEFNHNGEVQQQMTELRSTVLSMPSADTTQSVTVDLGLRYPSRTIFRNPPPVSGTLRTLDTGDPAYNITIANAEPTNDDLAQLWAQEGSRYNTGAVEYRPSYNQYRSAPQTIYAHSVLYNKFDRENQQLPITGQSLVRGDEISLVALNGSLRETRIDSASVDFEPVSTQTRTVELTSDGGPVTLEIPTRLTNETWNRLLESELERNVTRVRVDQNAFDGELGLLRIELARGNYNLKLAKVGVGTAVTQEPQAYITDVAGNGSVIQTGETQELAVEVRNRFNEPLAGAEIRASAEGGVFDNDDPTTTAETGTDGQVTLQYTGSGIGQNDINVTIESFQPVRDEPFDATTRTNLTMTVEVTSSQNNQGGNAAYSISWQPPDATGDNAGSSLSNCDEEDCTWDVGASSDDTLILRAGTSPTIEGANVDLAIDNSTIGSISPDDAVSDSDGEVTTELAPRENGTIGVYAISGGTDDVINVTVENVTAGNRVASFPRVAYSVPSGPIRGLDENRVTDDYPVSFGVSGIGQPNIDIDGDAPREVPFVDGNNNLRVTDTAGSTELLDGSGNVNGGKLGVGDWNDDGTQEVVYVRDSKLYSATTSSSTLICNGGSPNPGGQCRGGGSPYGAGAVAGVGNFDGAGGQDIVYVDGNGNLVYIDDEGDSPTEVVSQLNNPSALGRPADYDGDNRLEVAYVDGNNDIALAEDSGFERTLSTSYDVATTPMSALDLTGDGIQEIVHINSNNGTLYYYDETTDSAVQVEDADGNTASAETDPGVG